MNTIVNMDPENLQARIKYLEENGRLIQNGLEMALSLGDFQENINKGYDTEYILREAEKRIQYLTPFDASAFYLTDQSQSDFIFSLCEPPEKKQFIEDQIGYMIDKGFFTWAMGEKRGITISSHDHSRQLMLHVIATASRIRGMYVGLLPDKKTIIPDKSKTLVSFILLNTANALESLDYHQLLRDQNDLLEKKVAERSKALARSEKQLQQVMKLQAIGTLAGGIAHDFNNILFPIVGYTELTMDDIPEGNPSRKNLEEVLKAANRAKKLVQQILTFSRQNDQEFKPLKVQSLIKEALNLLRATIPSSIEIDTSIDEDCGLVKGDPTQIHQVMMNLGTNAYHALQETGGKLEVILKETYLSYEQSQQMVGMKVGRHLELTVRDNGHGMFPQVLERIFEPYYTTKEQGKGTGLGLSVIHGIIKNHGGDISVCSQPGVGSTFRVYLPVIDDIDMEIEAPETANETNGNEHILLIDDEEPIIDIERRILERLGYTVTPITDSEAALEEFKARPDAFDLVITDMTMPKITGDRLAQSLMDINPQIPVILCTGFNEDITEEKALSMGIDKFVMKPIVKDELAYTIRSVLDNPKSLPN
ncbi:MAG: ATP-binding protein [Desulfobacterales bacterium]|jgi:signal transduction histidine kinase/ActR/RegA family two-component response regulator